MRNLFRIATAGVLVAAALLSLSPSTSPPLSRSPAPASPSGHPTG